MRRRQKAKRKLHGIVGIDEKRDVNIGSGRDRLYKKE